MPRQDSRSERQDLLDVVHDPNWMKVAGLPTSANVDDVVAFFDKLEFPPDKVRTLGKIWKDEDL